MKLKLNGEEKEFGALASLGDLLRSMGITPGAPGTAVALNGHVIPRAKAEETPIRDGDRIEIVRAVQGG